MARKSIPATERSLAFGSISGTFANLGTALTQPFKQYWIQNLTDAYLEFTWDGGGNVNLTLPPNSGMVIDDSTNVPQSDQEPPLLAVGTQFQVRHTGVAPTVRSAKVCGLYTLTS